MRARVIKLKGVDSMLKKLTGFEREAPGICKKAVYNGAGPMADEFRAELSAISVDRTNVHNVDKSKWGRNMNRGPVIGLTEDQKRCLLDRMGISDYLEKIEVINKKIGVEGYNNTKTKKYPNGQPNAMILRSIERGTSWHAKTPVIRNTVNKMRNETEETMKKTIIEEINKIMK